MSEYHFRVVLYKKQDPPRFGASCGLLIRMAALKAGKRKVRCGNGAP